MLALVDAPAHQPVFEAVIVPSEPEAVQIAGVTSLGRIPGAGTPTFLLAKWPALPSNVRTAAATVVLGRREGSIAMLDAIQQGTVKLWMLNFGHTRSLIMHRDEQIRARARTVLEVSPEQRAARMSRYAAALGGRGDVTQGAGVFTKNCAMCHQVDGKGGVEIGPDLSTVRHQPTPVLLSNILEPNRSIAQHYETYSVERAAGDPLVGVIGEQSPTSITFRQGPGVTTTVRRSDIKTMTVVPQSIMPESFSEQITPDDMAHLLAYLTTAPRGRHRERRNAARPVRGRRDGCSEPSVTSIASGPTRCRHRCGQARRPYLETDGLDTKAVPASLMLIVAASALAQPPLPDAKTATPAVIAAALLDDRQDQKAREGLAREAAPRASAVVQALVAGTARQRRDRRVPAHPVDLARCRGGRPGEGRGRRSSR